MIRRWLILALLCAASAAQAQTNFVERNPGGNPQFVKQPGVWTANDLLCVTGPNQIGIGGTCNALGGGGGSGGTGGTAASWTETVTTSAGNPYVETINTIPAGATVQRCIATTTTDIAGGYGFGVEGAPNIYGKLAGTSGETSATGNYFVAPHMNVVTSPRRITSRHASGLFQSTPGQAEVTCFYVVY